MAAAAKDVRADASSARWPAIVASVSSMFAVMINSSSGVVRNVGRGETPDRHAPAPEAVAS
jgi:hypothetical protein